MTYQIFVKNTHTGETMAFDVREDNTLLDIKNDTRCELNLPQKDRD